MKSKAIFSSDGEYIIPDGMRLDCWECICCGYLLDDIQMQNFRCDVRCKCGRSLHYMKPVYREDKASALREGGE